MVCVHTTLSARRGPVHSDCQSARGWFARPLGQGGSGLAGSLGRSGRGAAKSSDPVGVAGRQNLLGVANSIVSSIIWTCWKSNPHQCCP